MKKETTMISIKLSKELVEKAKQKALEEETTVSALIRKLLLDYTKEKPQEDITKRKLLLEDAK
jgi:hypothetical protein